MGLSANTHGGMMERSASPTDPTTDTERDQLWVKIEAYASADEQLGYACALGRGYVEADREVTRTRAELRAALGFTDSEEG